MKIRALVVDDEQLARRYLRSILEEIGDVEVIGEAGNWGECVRLADEFRPNAVFLDIRMPEVSGMDAAARLMESPTPPFIVFVTGYDEYAVAAFETSATDYIMKPYESARVEKAISKIRRALVDRSLAERDSEEPESDQASEPELTIERLPVRVEGSIRLLDPANINYIHCESKKVFIRTGSREYRTNLTLTQLENRLPKKRFFRANEGCLVNMEKVREINYLGDENYELVLADKEETIIPLSRSRAKILRKTFGW